MRIALVTLVLCGFCEFARSAPKPWEDPDKWLQAQGGEDLAELKKLSEDELYNLLHNDLAGEGKEHEWTRDEMLCEIVRRGGQPWDELLKHAMERIRAARSVDLFTRRFSYRSELEVLAALRRIQRRPAPLRIEVKPLAKVRWEFPSVPDMEVAVSRHPDETENFYFQFGGNYRSGRQARWSVLAWNEAGNLRERVVPTGIISDGGARSIDWIGDRTWETTLAGSQFLQSPVPPGRYRARLVYHDRERIADSRHLAGFVLHYSEPFEFEVLPRVVKALAVPRGEVRALVDGLPEEGEVKILKASYTKDAHEFIGPESAAGQLLSLGWPVVPALHAELLRPELSSTQRAWGLGILHSVTGSHDPTRWRHVLGDYRWRSGVFFLEERNDGEPGVASLVSGGEGAARRGPAAPEAQLALLEEWRGVLACLIQEE